MHSRRWRTPLVAATATLAWLSAHHAVAQEPKAPAAGSVAAAGDIADVFGQAGDQIYEHCIFDLSQEQIEVQQALIEAYVKQGASSPIARQLAVQQIHPPKLSDECARLNNPWLAEPKVVVAAPPAPTRLAAIPPKVAPKAFVPTVPLAERKVLPQWDCAPGIDYVSIQHRGYERKLTGGEICSPFRDVVNSVPDSLKSFRLGYTISTGRLFIISDDPNANGRTVTWAISGREGCRNNPDPDCLATRAVGPLPPGEYAFASDRRHRVTWGPKSQRMVAGVYLTKLWHRERFTPAQQAAIRARGNIAIHVRLKGEMSEACLGLEPKGWAYVSSLIQSGRATGLSVYIDEPHVRMAEAPPVIRTSSFSLSSLLK